MHYGGLLKKRNREIQNTEPEAAAHCLYSPCSASEQKHSSSSQNNNNNNKIIVTAATHQLLLMSNLFSSPLRSEPAITCQVSTKRASETLSCLGRDRLLNGLDYIGLSYRPLL